jgi:hypothetical protein
MRFEPQSVVPQSLLRLEPQLPHRHSHPHLLVHDLELGCAQPKSASLSWTVSTISTPKPTTTLPPLGTCSVGFTTNHHALPPPLGRHGNAISPEHKTEPTLKPHITGTMPGSVDSNASTTKRGRDDEVVDSRRPKRTDLDESMAEDGEETIVQDDEDEQIATASMESLKLSKETQVTTARLPIAHTCYTRLTSKSTRLTFRPCCIPAGAGFTWSFMLFKHYFKNNLGGRGPPKTLTHRNWIDSYARFFLVAFDQGQWIRAWIGQGNDTTIGWLLITSMRNSRGRDITADDCAREGRPDMSPSIFLKTLFWRKP